jgi:outer membrane usher protein
MIGIDNKVRQWRMARASFRHFRDTSLTLALLIIIGWPTYADVPEQVESEHIVFHDDESNPMPSTSTEAQPLTLSADSVVYKENEEFNTLFLHSDKGGAEGIFFYANNIMPGVKDVDIVINEQRTVRQKVNFIVDKKSNRVVPCLNRQALDNLGVKTKIYSGWSNTDKGEDPEEQCENVENIIADSVVSYDDALQKISIRLPQEAVSSDILRMISPTEWDNGVPSLRFNYDGYVYNSKARNGNDRGTKTNAYFSVGSTATLGAWRFYSYDTFTKNADESGWDSNHDRAYAVRDIPAIYSKIQAGDIYTYSPSNILGVLPLRGVTLATNGNMMADNQFRYAPVIRGTARTNARVTVRQRGNIIYSTTVTPGSFAIEDMYAGQVGADLQVTVEEADGSVQTFNVPYTSLPNMLRPNANKYSISIGEYRDKKLSDKPIFAAASYEHGFELFTLNTSLLAAKDYQAGSIGAAWNVGSIGAFSLDAAYARYNNLDNDFYEKSNGGSAIRFLYAKQFESTNTGLRILGYQYRSEDFLELSEYVNLNNSNNRHSSSNWPGLYKDGELLRRRSRLEANINQGLGDFGSFYLTAYYDRYYNTSDANRSISAGYSTNIQNVTMSLDYTYSKYSHSDTDSQINLNFSIPFSWGNNNFGSVGYSLMRDADDNYSQSVTTSGVLDKNRFNYSLNVIEDHEANFSESLYLGYNSSYGNLSASASHSKYSNQYSFGLGGGVLVYGGGVVLSQRLGDTVAIVETPDASGVGVSSNLNISTDYWGRAVVPYMTAYRYNNIELNLENSKNNVELMSSAQKVVPSAGATVVARFGTRVGRRAIVVVTPPQGVAIPLAAPVYGKTKLGQEEFGMMGHNGEAYLTGLDAKKNQTLIIKWGDSAGQQCQFTLPALTKEQQNNAEKEWYNKVQVNCR